MKLKNKGLLLILILCGILATIYSFSFAKYVSNSVWNYYLETKKFYFESDHLGINTINNVNNNWDGNSINFNLKNSKNSTLISNYDIEYTASCVLDGIDIKNAECVFDLTKTNTLNGTISSTEQCINHSNDGIDVSGFTKQQCSEYNYELVESINNVSFNVIEKNGFELTDATVLIQVASTSPYAKTLKGKYILHKNNSINGDINMNYENFDDYVRLNITNSYNTSKCISVSFDPNELVIDYEPEIYNTDINGYINNITVNVDLKNEKSFIFYKKNISKTYDLTDFSLEESNGC